MFNHALDARNDVILVLSAQGQGILKDHDTVLLQQDQIEPFACSVLEMN